MLNLSSDKDWSDFDQEVEDCNDCGSLSHPELCPKHNNMYENYHKIQDDNIGDFCIVCLQPLTIEQKLKGVCAEHDNPNLNDSIVQESGSQ